MKTPRESQIERYMVRRVERIGGICFKFVSPGRVGVPDRVVVLPGGEVIFVEIKAPGGVLSPMQVRVHKCLKALTAEVKTFWNTDQIDRYFPIEEQEDRT